MEVWGRPSSPLLVLHTPVPRRPAILQGGSPGWGRQPWHSCLPKGSCLRCPWEKWPQLGCASHLGSLFFRETQSPSPHPPRWGALSGVPKSCAVAACPEGCQALAATPLHPLPWTGWLGSSRRWGCAAAHTCLPPWQTLLPSEQTQTLVSRVLGAASAPARAAQHGLRLLRATMVPQCLLGPGNGCKDENLMEI